MTDSETPTNGKAVLVWTAQDVAERLQVSEETVKNLRRAGLLMPITIGRHHRWLPSVVDEYLESLKENRP